jgi:regulator of protease activity HflC (stomatin/prohibitin superfamily)
MKYIPLIGLALLSAACSYQKVPPGHVGILVYLLGTDKGVESEEVGVGRIMVGVNEELHLFPIFKQNYVWTKDRAEGSPNDEGLVFQTREGLEVGADVGITYFLEKDKVHNIFQKYRRGVEELTDVFLRNHVRDALIDVVSNMPVDKVYGAGKGEILQKVTARVRENVGADGINVEKIYFVGSFRLPEVVVTSVNEKIQATQKAITRQNEIEETKAQARKREEEAQGIAKAIKIKAQAQAEANQIILKSLTDDLIRYKAIEKWDGILPKVTSDVLPMIDVGGAE